MLCIPFFIGNGDSLCRTDVRRRLQAPDANELVLTEFELRKQSEMICFWDG